MSKPSFRIHLDEERLKQEAIDILKEEIKERLADFKKTPAGKIFREGVKEIMQAKSEGRDPTPEEVFAFLNRIPAIVKDKIEGE